jgi:phosphodiesterase/alkaline phosphatase D-like protein
MANVNQLALHHATQTAAVVWLRSTSSGVLTVQCNGQTFTGDTIDTAVDDGCGVCTVTGLAAGTSYHYTASVGGAVVGSGTIKTLPASGATLAIGFGTCCGYTRDQVPLRALAEHAPDLAGFCWLGDNIYANEPVSGATATLNGETILGVERDGPLVEATTLAQLYKHYRAYWQYPCTARMLKSVPNWFIGDDHDHGPGNNWDGTLTAANETFTWASTQQQVDNMGAWCRAAMRAYYKGNPNVGNPWYFSVRVNDDLELFFVDGVAYRDASDGSGTTLLGSTQKAWLKAGIQNSTATFKGVMCGKNLYGGADDYSKYAAERAEMEDFFETSASWAKPGGAIWCSGDIHYPFMSGEPNAPIFNICASPLGTGHAATVANGFQNKQRWKVSGHVSSGVGAVAVPPAVGYLRVHGATRMDVGLMRIDGALLWSGYLLPGSNAMRYDAPRVG